MGGDIVIVAGIGFRGAAPPDSLHRALALALAQTEARPQLLASAPAKVASPQLQGLARALDLPLRAVDVAGVATPTQSPQIKARFQTGSLAEAAALAAAGPGARLIVGRVVSPDGMASAAIAEGDGP